MNPFWLLMASGVLLGTGLGLGLWAVLWDRARGRKRCPACWYDMSGAPIAPDGPRAGEPLMRCSECGRKVRAEAELFLTRRRWWLAVAAVLLLAGAGWSAWRAIPDGMTWQRLVPSAVLVRFVPLSNAEQTWERESGTWEARWAVPELRRRSGAGLLTEDQVRDGILGSKFIRTTPTWDRTRPLAVWMRLPTWLEGSYKVAAAPRLSRGAKDARASGDSFGGCGNAMMLQEAEESFQVVGWLEPGASSVRFDVWIVGDSYLAPRNFEWKGVVDVPVAAVEPAPPTPDPDPAITAAMRSSIQIVSWGQGDQGAVMLMVHFDRGDRWDLASDVFVECEVTLLKNGVACASDRARDPDEGDGGWIGWQELRAPGLPPIPGRGWSLRVRGVAPTEPTRWCRRRYWSGEFEAPLGELVSPRFCCP